MASAERVFMVYEPDDDGDFLHVFASGVREEAEAAAAAIGLLGCEARVVEVPLEADAGRFIAERLRDAAEQLEHYDPEQRAVIQARIDALVARRGLSSE